MHASSSQQTLIFPSQCKWVELLQLFSVFWTDMKKQREKILKIFALMQTSSLRQLLQH